MGGIFLKDYILTTSLALFLFFLCILWVIIIIYEYIKTKDRMNLFLKIFLISMILKELAHPLIKILH